MKKPFSSFYCCQLANVEATAKMSSQKMAITVESSVSSLFGNKKEVHRLIFCGKMFTNTYLVFHYTDVPYENV